MAASASANWLKTTLLTFSRSSVTTSTRVTSLPVPAVVVLDLLPCQTRSIPADNDFAGRKEDMGLVRINCNHGSNHPRAMQVSRESCNPKTASTRNRSRCPLDRPSEHYPGCRRRSILTERKGDPQQKRHLEHAVQFSSNAGFSCGYLLLTTIIPCLIDMPTFAIAHPPRVGTAP